MITAQAAINIIRQKRFRHIFAKW